MILYKQLNNYLNWTMFKIEDNKEKSTKIRQMIDKMKTVITNLMIKPKKKKTINKYDERFRCSLLYTQFVIYLKYNIIKFILKNYFTNKNFFYKSDQ